MKLFKLFTRAAAATAAVMAVTAVAGCKTNNPNETNNPKKSFSATLKSTPNSANASSQTSKSKWIPMPLIATRLSGTNIASTHSPKG